MGVEPTVLNTCDMCGLCCRLFYINLNESEYYSRNYQKILDEFGEIDDFDIAKDCGANLVDVKEDGSCIYLLSGKCSIHARRPTVCREFYCRGDEVEFRRMREIIAAAR